MGAILSAAEDTEPLSTAKHEFHSEARRTRRRGGTPRLSSPGRVGATSPDGGLPVSRHSVTFSNATLANRSAAPLGVGGQVEEVEPLLPVPGADRPPGRAWVRGGGGRQDGRVHERRALRGQVVDAAGDQERRESDGGDQPAGRESASARSGQAGVGVENVHEGFTALSADCPRGWVGGCGCGQMIGRSGAKAEIRDGLPSAVAGCRVYNPCSMAGTTAPRAPEGAAG
jgi:hypothetical protein